MISIYKLLKRLVILAIIAAIILSVTGTKIAGKTIGQHLRSLYKPLLGIRYVKEFRQITDKQFYAPTKETREALEKSHDALLNQTMEKHEEEVKELIRKHLGEDALKKDREP